MQTLGFISYILLVQHQSDVFTSESRRSDVGFLKTNSADSAKFNLYSTPSRKFMK